MSNIGFGFWKNLQVVKPILGVVLIVVMSYATFASSASDTTTKQAPPAPGTTVCDDGDPEVISLVNEYADALESAKVQRDKTEAKLVSIQNENPALDKALEGLENASKEAQIKAKKLALEEMKRSLPNPSSWKSVLKWAYGKFKAGDEVSGQYKKIFSEYNNVKNQIENELGVGTSWDEKVEKAEREAGAAKEDYENIHSWIDFFIALDEGNVGACITY